MTADMRESSARRSRTAAKLHPYRPGGIGSLAKRTGTTPRGHSQGSCAIRVQECIAREAKETIKERAAFRLPLLTAS
ncbi:MAG: hypothetical protein C4532_14330 [Candidatus Abyssobacteria bacterium SURF_17]|uniref:Uncharacterized protein n=1 Tax=Candidatus Abyssobacteria bacterium SURF_17 TaxID=2093361 RepID=A0A419EU17_9BACT|nr:MAG: hypothetical protein C4532_14330 [Candidatus Abyssubacteria bacterium SURF_17]